MLEGVPGGEAGVRSPSGVGDEEGDEARDDDEEESNKTIDCEEHLDEGDFA